MSLRSGMVEIIDRVRSLCNVLADANSWLEDDRIQEHLDRHRLVVKYAPMLTEGRIAPGGSVSYLDFTAPYQNWEGTASGRPFGYQLVDGGYNDITSSGSVVNDPVQGWWTFGTAPTRPVMISGATYDIFGAAADILQNRLAQLAEEFDFQTQGLDYKVSQKQARLMQVIADYRAQSRGMSGDMVRSDTW